jgi:hypothetical protein
MINKTTSLYLDTSIFGDYYDDIIAGHDRQFMGWDNGYLS